MTYSMTISTGKDLSRIAEDLKEIDEFVKGTKNLIGFKWDTNKSFEFEFKKNKKIIITLSNEYPLGPNKISIMTPENEKTFTMNDSTLTETVMMAFDLFRSVVSQYNESNEDIKLNPFQALPNNVFLRILSYLNIGELGRFSIVSKYWKSFTMDATLWRKLNLAPYTKVNDHIIGTMIQRANFVLDVSLENCDAITNAGVNSVAVRGTLLQNLNLNNCIKLTTESLYEIGNYCPNLKHLSLRNCKSITGEGIDMSKWQCGELEHLDVSGCVNLYRDFFLTLCEKSPKITYLDMSGCLQREDPNLPLRFIGKKLKLEYLNVSRINGIVDNGMDPVLTNCTALKTLHLERCVDISDNSIQLLCNNCTNLETLDINYCTGLSGSSIHFILKYLKLKQLSVQGANILVKTLRSLSQRGDLQNVEVIGFN